MSVVTAADKRHIQASLVLPEPPDDDEKYAYIQRNLPYLTTALVIGSACLIISQVRFELHDLVLAPFLVFTATYVVYQMISLPVNFAGRGFDLAAHQERIRGWHPVSYPRVDIFLPICGEPIELLRNTWIAVSGLIADYGGLATANVLDDGPSDDARSMAGSFGFSYIRRPDLPAYKKAGNLRYAFAHTSAEQRYQGAVGHVQLSKSALQRLGPIHLDIDSRLVKKLVNAEIHRAGHAF